MKNCVIDRRCTRRTKVFLALAALGFAPFQSFAQTAPDAGRTLQQQAPSLQAPKTSPEVKVEPAKGPETLPGGAEVVLSSVKVEGNTLFSEADLLKVLGNVSGKKFDLAGLRGLADRISTYYHEAGYPFARAYVPTQPLQAGVLRLEVVEGQYGQVRAVGDQKFAPQAAPFLSALQPGKVIESQPLERATLILGDQPGVEVVPVMRPGQSVGQGDLDVKLARTSYFAGEVGFDNEGNRYTGQNRAHFNLDVNSPFMLGDQVTLRTLLTEEGMWFGNLGYSLPLGGSGLRAQAGYGHTYYELGKSFSSLRASGTADVTSLGLSYPIIRSQQTNVTLLGNWIHKGLHDKQVSTGTNTHKSSDSWPVGVNFDIRDGFAGGGITYGNATWTTGHLNLDSSLLGTDSTTAKTAGGFSKVNLEAARIQTLSSSLSVYGHLASQWADKNLDSSERFGLGGPTGVRAYPVGEGYGDSGWLAQVEMRYAVGQYVPFAFYDSGWVKVNQNPWAAGSNERAISGYGVGARYLAGPWSADLTLAWRDQGGRPQSDTQHNLPQGWVTLAYKF